MRFKRNVEDLASDSLMVELSTESDVTESADRGGGEGGENKKQKGEN
jgi:hypothetical protein